MSRHDIPDSNRPILVLGGYALQASHVIALVYVVSMFLTTGFMGFGVTAPFVWLPFTSDAVLRGEVWRLFTYGLLNPPSLWFVIDLFMLVWFGRELEKFFGRRIFLRLYACLYLLTPVLFTVLGLALPLRLSGQTGAFALFIGFATLYPGALFFFNLQARWLALILVGIYTLIALANRDVAGLVSLLAGAGFAHGYVRHEQGRLVLPKLAAWFNRPKLRVLPGQAPATPRRTTPLSDEAMADVDALLDKIAHSGIHSLSAEERARLDRSSAELLKRKGTVRGNRRD